MAILSTKDYSAAKMNKIQKAVGEQLGLVGDATKAQVEKRIEYTLKQWVEDSEDRAFQATKPARDENF